MSATSSRLQTRKNASRKRLRTICSAGSRDTTKPATAAMPTSASVTARYGRSQVATAHPASAAQIMYVTQTPAVTT